MSLRHVLMTLLIGVLALSCSDDDNKPTNDGSVTQDAKVGDGTPDTVPKPDKPVPDLDLSKAPVIEEILPSDGFADGGTLGHIPVIMIGKNFDKGARVFIDGGAAPNGIIMEVSVQSPVTVSFNMPPQPYDTSKPYKADVSIQVNGMISNVVKFQYTVSQEMDAKFTGSVVTASTSAYAEFNSKPIEAKVFAEGITDTTTGDSGKLKVDIGFGAVGTDPSKDAGWKWLEAKFVKDDGTYDVYSGTLKVPVDKTYDVAYRFSTKIPTFLKGQVYVYADTDETDPKYDVAKAAKLIATKAPDGYCQVDQDCMLEAYAKICQVDPVDDAKSHCIECETDTDCTKNPTALGPKCETSQFLCYCDDKSQCASNPNGLNCLPANPGYCGCQGDTDCPSGAHCVQTPDGLQICQ
jgi:hypothetical protein